MGCFRMRLVRLFIKRFPLIGLCLLLGFSLPALTVAAEEKAAASPAACTACGFEPEAAALDRLLLRYKALAEAGGWPQWVMGKKIMAHKTDPRIPALRKILAVTGDYALPPAMADDTHLDDALIAGVKSFQAHHGLNPDGTLGKSTQAALAVPIEGRINQITATIERIRVRAQPPESRFILVNLPAYMLFAVDRGQTKLIMRTIIGNRKNHTPLFDNAVTDVIFNPQWHVPERIAKKEMIPKLREDPAYFVKAGFVVTEDGQPIDPSHLAPGSLPPEKNDFTFRQLAGDENALGKVKFNIPDSDDIYLHSTATPRLFAKDDRALSHGCIRVENPRELAYFIFGGKADWDQKRIDKAYDGDKERWVRVGATPVHLVYWTAFVDVNGSAYFYSDIYGKDNAAIADRGSAVTLAAQ